MPFDPARVTILPPSLREPVQPPVIPERGGDDPRRVHVEIVVHMPAAPKRRRGALWWWLLALMVLALAAHAQQPTGEWRTYPFGGGIMHRIDIENAQ